MFPKQAFGHDSFDPRHGHTTENLHQTFLKTLQGEALPSLIKAMMGHLQDVMLKSDTLGRSKDHWEVDGIFAFCYKVRRPASCRNSERVGTVCAQCRADVSFCHCRWCSNQATWLCSVKNSAKTSARLDRQHRKRWCSMHWRTLKSLTRYFQLWWLVCQSTSLRALTVPERLACFSAVNDQANGSKQLFCPFWNI